MSCIEKGKDYIYRDEHSPSLSQRLAKIGSFMASSSHVLLFFGTMYLCAQMQKMARLQHVSIFNDEP